jgi:hypothetical protein
MHTKYPEIFAALAAPFAAREVKTRSQSGKQLSYITARTAMNRLDSVLGPECWSDEYVEGRDGLKCRLTITLPDGSKVSKEDGGAAAGMSDADNDEKSAFSSAFKRAAVKFGVGRYLYQDGVPDFFGTGIGAATRDPQASLPGPGSTGRRSNGTTPAYDSPQGLFYQQLAGLQAKHSNGRGLVAHLLEWGQGQGLPKSIRHWPEGRLADAQEEARFYLRGGVTVETN